MDPAVLPQDLQKLENLKKNLLTFTAVPVHMGLYFSTWVYISRQRCRLIGSVADPDPGFGIRDPVPV